MILQVFSRFNDFVNTALASFIPPLSCSFSLLYFFPRFYLFLFGIRGFAAAHIGEKVKVGEEQEEDHSVDESNLKVKGTVS
jgi:hypothetical protein